MNNYFLINPNVSGFIKKQRKTNAILIMGITAAAVGILAVESYLIERRKKVAELENRINELECEKTV